jgi:hypothetical protein
MNRIEISLSNFDRAVSLFGALNSYQSRKLNEEILFEHYKSNNHLSELNRKIAEANSINKKILENQLVEIKAREAQKYYKALSYFLYEVTSELKRTDDLMVLSYIMGKYYSKTKQNLLDAIKNCEEISDKSFSNCTLKDLEALKKHCDQEAGEYSKSVLFNIDSFVEDYTKLKDNLSKTSMPTLNQKPIDISRFAKVKSWLRIVGISLFTILAFFTFSDDPESVSQSKVDRDFRLVSTIFRFFFIAIPLYLLIKKELKFRKELKEKIKEKNTELIDFNRNKKRLEDDYLERRNKLESEIANHPLPNLLNQITIDHPSLDNLMVSLDKITREFDLDWKFKKPNI